MLPRRLLLVLLTLLFVADLSAARQRAVRHPEGWHYGQAPQDVFSFSEPLKVTTKHVILDLTVDFAQRRLRGSATLEIENLTGTDTLVLDTSALTIERVTLDRTATPAQWSFGTANEFGRALRVTIAPATRFVTIDYTTAANPRGLFWIPAEQTFGGVEPFLYSLNEPVGARGWIPLQDTPSVRVTYEATLRVPRQLMALMSAADNPTATNDTGVYVFHMPYRIPSYLISLGVGRLEFRAFDERTGVYAEPELIDDAAWELAYLDEMVDLAEGMLGTFPFERHDLLLPPHFGGGMEHPMLNIVGPFPLVTGNKPARLTPSSLIAHELAHSWAGDSATLANWDDIWINEGITSYLTERILEAMDGVERVEYNWLQDRVGYAAFAGSAPDDRTTLHFRLSDPRFGFGSTSYIKGALFLKTLEDTIGRAQFDFFLRRYFQIYAYHWVDDLSFLAALREFAIRGDAALEASLLLDEWLYEGGLPSNVTAPTSSSLLDRAIDRANRFSSGTPLAQLDPGSWTPLELDLFLQHADVTDLRTRIAEVDTTFGLSARNTPPVAFLHQALEANYTPAYPAVERLLLRGSPGGTMVALYQTLVRTGKHDMAVDIFNRARSRYTDSVENQVRQILGLTSAKESIAA